MLQCVSCVFIANKITDDDIKRAVFLFIVGDKTYQLIIGVLAPSVQSCCTLLIYAWFLPCICLRHISQIQTCLCVVVGSGCVSTSSAFMSSIASHL